MNATTIANHMTNMTSSTVQTDPPIEEGENSIGAYTSVLAVTAHISAMLFGGGKSVTVITAILTKGNINKYSYLLVLTLLFACCCVNFVYSPLEISDLLTFHFYQRHPSDHFVAVKTAVYIFLIALISIIIVLIALEAIFRRGECFGRILQRFWPLTTCLFALVWSAILMSILITKLIDSPDSTTATTTTHSSYAITDNNSRVTFLTLITFICSVVFLVLVVLLVQFLKSCIYWEDGRPHFRKKKMSLAMPEFLISQSHDCGEDEEDTGGYDNFNEPSTSRTPSPSTPKLLMVSSPDSASIKGGEAMPITQTTPNKSSGNRLGINMAHVLGRRRHTICQISDNSAPAPADPIVKAKQYNYVRKFSVDISALQAQLQNPKIFKEAPFQSDIDLAKKAEEAKNNKSPPKPLQPLQPLNLKLDEKKPPEKETTTEIKVETPQSAGLSIPPPVIMVSNDDAIPEKEDNNATDDEKENACTDQLLPDNVAAGATTTEDTSCKNNLNLNNHQLPNTNTNNNNSRPEIPTCLSLKEPNNQIIENEILTSMPTFESSAMTDDPAPSDNTDLDGGRGDKLSRLSAGMCITFLITMLPVIVMQALRHSNSNTSSSQFVNISTCTLAFSIAIQTIVYPHLIACCDDVVRRAVQRMTERLKRALFCGAGGVSRDDEYSHQHQHSKNVDESSSTSHV